MNESLVQELTMEKVAQIQINCFNIKCEALASQKKVLAETESLLIRRLNALLSAQCAFKDTWRPWEEVLGTNEASKARMQSPVEFHPHSDLTHQRTMDNSSMMGDEDEMAAATQLPKHV